MSTQITSRIAVSPLRQELLDALIRHCMCEFNKASELVAVCPGHDALGSTQFVVHMEFGKYLAESGRLRREEGLEPAEEPEPYMLSEFAYSVLKAADLR